MVQALREHDGELGAVVSWPSVGLVENWHPFSELRLLRRSLRLVRRGPDPASPPLAQDERTERIDAAADLLGYAQQAAETDGLEVKVEIARVALTRLGVTEHELAVAERILAGGAR